MRQEWRVWATGSVARPNSQKALDTILQDCSTVGQPWLATKLAILVVDCTSSSMYTALLQTFALLTPKSHVRQVLSTAPMAESNKSRGTNFTIIAKLKQLCCSWMHISQVLIVGGGQCNLTFWDRVRTHYNDHRPEAT